MIVEAILTFLFTPFTFLLETVPTFAWPEWMGNCPSSGSPVCGGASMAGDQLSFFQGWINIDALLTVANFSWFLFAATQTVRGARFLLSLFTGGGGA